MNIETPIGRYFNENAEALACYALEKPAVTSSEAGLAVGTLQDFSLPAVLMLHCGPHINKPIKGFVKSTNLRWASREILIGQIATLLGAPSAPSILVQGHFSLDDWVIKHGYYHKPNMALFSALTFDDYWHVSQTTHAHHSTESIVDGNANSAALAAAGQFTVFTNNHDTVIANMVRDEKTKGTCLFDYEMARPYERITADNPIQLVRRGWETRNSAQARAEYLDAAKEMARRICNIRRRDFSPLVQALHANGLPAPCRLIDGLLQRRPLFERPAFLDCAERAGWNIGWRKPRQIFDLKVG